METSTRPRLKHVMTATAFGLVTIRNAWRTYFHALSAERRETAKKHQQGWGG
jgi:hypothetical protein